MTRITDAHIMAMAVIIAEDKLRIDALEAENAELRARLELVTGPVKADDRALADLVRGMA